MDNCTALGMYKATISKVTEMAKFTAMKLSKMPGEIGMIIIMISVMIKSAKMMSLDLLMNSKALSPPKDLTN